MSAILLTLLCAVSLNVHFTPPDGWRVTTVTPDPDGADVTIERVIAYGEPFPMPKGCKSVSAMPHEVATP